ncbi:MAG TPA: class I SAM-dependent methyltransferase [Thermoplasmata archaeon]|nr:class I SAM-dependent methyltransferase [Thermoplasmata archaeon]
MGGYYRDHLLGSDLQRVYEIASPRIRQYLRAEIQHVVERVRGSGRVLELGCGYGRVLGEIAPHVGRAIGVDIARENLRAAQSHLRALPNCDLVLMDAVALGFPDAELDATICVQNGISAFRVDPLRLVAEAIRVTKEGGRILFSTYSSRIWADRLEWFRSQANAGLVGAIDESQTREGIIVCRDGLRLTTASPDVLRALFADLGQSARVYEIDDSSVFVEVTKREPSARSR